MDGEQGLELVWGMGMVRWRLGNGRVIDHPVVEQLDASNYLPVTADL